MKKGVLNYSITWQEDGEKREKLYFTKFATVAAYIDILRECRTTKTNISSLRIWEVYQNINKPAEDITGRVNRFLA